MNDLSQNSAVKLEGFERAEDFLAARDGIYRHNAKIMAYIEEAMQEANPDFAGIAENLGDWAAFTSSDKLRNVDSIASCYLPGDRSKLSPTYAEDDRLDDEGRKDYFTHLAESLENLCVVFKKVKVYPEGLPTENAAEGVFKEASAPAVVVDYSFCGINKDGKVEERPAYGSFSFAKDDAGAWKFVDHNSVPSVDVPDYKQDLYAAVKDLVPRQTTERAAPVAEGADHSLDIQ